LSDASVTSHTFYGFTILPVASSPLVARPVAAELFYEARLGIINTSGYHDLYSKLIDAAETLDYSSSQTLNLEKACEAVNIRHGIVGLTLKDESGTSVTLLQDVGKLQLKGTLTTATLSINTSDGGLILRNNEGTVVGFINASTANGGQMIIRDDLTRGTFPSESSDNLLVVRYDGVPVTTLDKDGKLKMSGGVEEDYDF